MVIRQQPVNNLITKDTIMKLKTRQEIAQEYGIVRETLYRKLKSEGIVLKRGLVNVEDQERIYKLLGKPRGLSNDNRDRIAF